MLREFLSRIIFSSNIKELNKSEIYGIKSGIKSILIFPQVKWSRNSGVFEHFNKSSAVLRWKLDGTIFNLFAQLNHLNINLDFLFKYLIFFTFRNSFFFFSFGFWKLTCSRLWRQWTWNMKIFVVKIFLWFNLIYSVCKL